MTWSPRRSWNSSIRHMIAAYHMEPLKPDEFVAYVLHRLSVAGWKGNPRFMPELFPELFRFSNGLPRRINHICSRLLLHGFLEEKSQLMPPIWR